jgi:hypothetical protein
MSQKIDIPFDDDKMLPEYDFSAGIRGKYYRAYSSSHNAVVLDPDVAEVFHNSAAVNEALRSLIQIARILML